MSATLHVANQSAGCSNFWQLASWIWQVRSMDMEQQMETRTCKGRGGLLAAWT